MVLDSLANFLFPWILPVIFVNFCLFSYLIYFHRKTISESMVPGKGSAYIWLFVIFGAAFLIRLLIPPLQHIMYVDEAWYMEAAKHILETGQQGSYPKAIGWPFLLSGLFLLFGVNNWVALYSMVVIGALTTVALFFLAWMVTRKKEAALFAAVLIALYPVHIRWSAAAETNVVSLFMTCLAVAGCFLYYRHKNRSLLWLAFSGVCFAAQFRPENYVLFVLFFAGDWMFNRPFIKQNLAFYAVSWLFFLLLSIPNLVQMMSFHASIHFMETESQGFLLGGNWSVHNLIYNTRHYGMYIFNGVFQPVLISLFALMGSMVLWIKDRKTVLFLFAWIGLFWFAYFSSWMQTLGGTEMIAGKARFFMSFYPAMILLASVGITQVLQWAGERMGRPQFQKYIYFAGAFLVSLFFLPYMREVPHMFGSRAYLLETQIPELAERDIPASCVIVANWPTILKSTTQLQVVDIRDFLADEGFQKKLLDSSDCVLLFDDVMCATFESEGGNCLRVKERYVLKDYISYAEGKDRYVFYQLLKRRDPEQIP